MNWQNQLISIYVNVCEYFSQDKERALIRISPNSNPIFTDEEAITIFIYGIINLKNDIKSIHMYTENHLKNWFQRLTAYESFNHRLNFLSPQIINFAEYFFQRIPNHVNNTEKIISVDFLPIMICKGFRSLKNRMGKNICNKGYCSSKDTHYYGVKLHIFADRNDAKLTIPRLLSITKASVHDLTAIREYLPEFRCHKILGDKAYSCKKLKDKLLEKGVELHTPVKLSRSRKTLTEEEKVYSQIVSSFRQSIEIFFNWLIEKTNIQNASKVRSPNGFIKHIFDRLAAALILYKFNF